MAVGLQFKKLDLHIHTPASHDFHDTSITAKDIVDKALAEGLHAVAITDHNTGSFIDEVKIAARNTPLVVFPGVEITCIGGKSGIHVIAIFDPSKDSSHVTGLLNALDAQPDVHGKEECIISKSVIDVIKKIALWKGLPVLAHVNSSKGVLCDMGGQQRIEIINEPTLLAVEATDLQSNRPTTRWLDGTDPNYKRKLAVYQASDNPSKDSKSGHSLESIGSRCSFFKLDVINLEGLRQCFIHPDARIRIDYKPLAYPKIVELSVGDGGFLRNQVFDFHEGLNSIIGGKGVGKSLAVEFLRFALDDHALDEDIKNDHLMKLSNYSKGL